MTSKTRSLLLATSLGFATTAGAQSFSYPDFSDTTGISPVGLTTQVGTHLQLQDNIAPASAGDNRGAAWYENAVNVVGGFDTTFVYRMHTPSTTGGSDGMAFVIQNDMIAGSPITPGGGIPDGTGNKAIGRHASAAGFGVFTTSAPGESVDNSVAIHFDTYNNGSWGDTNSNHISIHTGGTGDNSQDEAMSLGRATPSVDLNNGINHTIRVVYVPGTLEVHVDGNLELSVPYDFVTGGTWVDSGTPVGGLNLIGGTSAYVGFTSGAGGAREFRDLMSWDFSSGGAAALYCTAKVNSLGCTPTIAASGAPSLSSPNPFDITCTDVINNKVGILFYGTGGRAAIPFQGGVLCVQPPIKRTALSSSGGNPPPNDCSGSYSFDFNAWAQGGSDPNLVSGTTVNAQYWMRDPQSPSTTGLSAGAEFTLQP